MESLENVQFVLLRGHSTEKTAKSYRTFVCRRSCETLTYDFKEYEFCDLENENCRPSRGKSSSKMDNACTCRLFVGKGSDGKIKVTYIPLHTGHNPVIRKVFSPVRSRTRCERWFNGNQPDSIMTYSQTTDDQIAARHDQAPIIHRLQSDWENLSQTS